jgi:hypothetical protein
MNIEWKTLKVTVGRVTVRLKTIVATLAIGAVSILTDPALQYLDFQPIISAFVSDEHRATLYGILVTITFTVLRSVTTGPLWEVAPRADDPDKE